MSLTASGDYNLPGNFAIRCGNMVLKSAWLVPGPLASWVINRHGYYQDIAPGTAQQQESQTDKKWQFLGLGDDLQGKRVLDIGCAEGFFSCQASRSGAQEAVGIDSSFVTLLCAQLDAFRSGLSARFKMGVFPELGLGDRFDYVLCLSVLHHTVSTKDIWKILTDSTYAADLEKLHRHLKQLAAITAPRGKCVVEMPFEYEDGPAPSDVDFQRFNEEFLRASFESVEYRGLWDSQTGQGIEKDRAIYVATAPAG